MLVHRKGRCFSFLWVYRQIYKRFLTNQSACCVWLGYVMSVYDIFQNLKRLRVPMSCRSLTFIRSADHSRSKMTPDISLYRILYFFMAFHFTEWFQHSVLKFGQITRVAHRFLITKEPKSFFFFNLFFCFNKAFLTFTYKIEIKKEKKKREKDTHMHSLI